MSGIGSHQSARMKNDEWLTPPHVLKALGAFDLDPCAPIKRPWEMAAQHYTAQDNGLQQPWDGRVWLNPPLWCRSRKLAGQAGRSWRGHRFDLRANRDRNVL